MRLVACSQSMRLAVAAARALKHIFEFPSNSWTFLHEVRNSHHAVIGCTRWLIQVGRFGVAAQDCGCCDCVATASSERGS
jgi:hypothetical protein